MTEDELLTGLVGALEICGWAYVHLGSDQRGVYRGAPGWPDLFAIHPNGQRGLAWELKGDGGRVTPDQAGWIALLRAVLVDRPMDVGLVRPADYDAALAWILTGERRS